MASRDWASALATCLVGEDLDLSGTPAEPQAVVDELMVRGWPASRIGDVARAQVDAELPWPFPVDREVVSRGPAQWYALLGQIRTLLQLDGDLRPPSTRTALTADERRLLQDVPPHW